MKKRIGFVSNSSSSSFLIDISTLNDKKKDLFFNHIDHAVKLGKYDKINDWYESDYGLYNTYDSWKINQFKSSDFNIYIASTLVNNFDLDYFLEDNDIDIICKCDNMSKEKVDKFLSDYLKNKLNKKLKKL